MDELSERLDLAVRLAREAGELTMRYFLSADLTVDRKADATPVTLADREAEELMRRRLDSACPQDAVLGEELGDKPGSTAYRWYLDPIDGTQSFIRGVPLFGTLVGLERGDQAVAGVIVLPALREIVYAGLGSGAWHATRLAAVSERATVDARPAHVSATAQLGAASFSTTALDGFDEAGRRAGYDRLLAAAAIGRGWSDCYGHYLVATGRIDVMVDPIMNVWDNAPLKPIVEEAGGRFTDLDGTATIHGTSALSTNGPLHEQVLALLRT